MTRLMCRTTTAVVILLALTAVACAPGAGFPLELTQADDGSTQSLAIGQQLSISLESNPTTGYLWEVDGAVPPQLVQVDGPEFTAESDALGAGGTEVWTFEGVSAGEATLTLKYWRSFEPDAAPEGTFEITVSVE